MRVETTPSYPISIFIAGEPMIAERICRDYCDDVGLCVTVSRTEYVYRGGSEDGVIVGLINYPRFPARPDEIEAKAFALADLLRQELEQESYSLQMPDKTVWHSWRAADLTTEAGK